MDAGVYLLLALPAVLGLNSVPFQRYQEQFLSPKWIRLANQGSSWNLTVTYSASKTTTAVWWINGEVADSQDFTIDNYVHHYITEYNGLNHISRRASIIIPKNMAISNLRLQLIIDVIDVTVGFNVHDLRSREVLIEEIPEYKLKLTPKDIIQYNVGDTLKLHIWFRSNGLTMGQGHEVTAKFITIPQGQSPNINILYGQETGDVLRLHTPIIGEDSLNSDEFTFRNNPNHIFRHLDFTYSDDDPPRGMLAVTSGYTVVETGNCRLFAGINVTNMAFIQPPPFDEFFPENVVLFDKIETIYVGTIGVSLDFTISVFGGRMKRIRFSDEFVNPDIAVTHHDGSLQPIVKIHRMFQTEAFFRIDNLTSDHLGLYESVATLGSYRTTRVFVIVVIN